MNPRVLSLDGLSVAYYSKVPKKGDYSGIYERKADPKQSVPLVHILAVGSLSAASADGAGDKAQIKKLGGAGKVGQMFKITFYAGALVEGEASAKHA